MIYNVKLIDTGYTVIDWFLLFIQILTFLCSFITVIVLVRNTLKQSQLEKMKLIITPKKRLANSLDEIFYLYLSFSNESALPISILDLRIEVRGERGISFTSSDDEDGILSVDPVRVIETDRVRKTVLRDFQTASTTVPFTIDPYGVRSGYFAFHESGQSSFVVCHKIVYLYVTTSRKSYRIEMDLNPCTFYQTSYRDDGLIFGRNVSGTSHQDTSVDPKGGNSISRIKHRLRNKGIFRF